MLYYMLLAPTCFNLKCCEVAKNMVHPDSDQFIKFGGHTGAYWHVRKCLWGFIYLFLAGFRFAFFLLLVM